MPRQMDNISVLYLTTPRVALQESGALARKLNGMNPQNSEHLFLIRLQ